MMIIKHIASDNYILFQGDKREKSQTIIGDSLWKGQVSSSFISKFCESLESHDAMVNESIKEDSETRIFIRTVCDLIRVNLKENIIQLKCVLFLLSSWHWLYLPLY